MKKLLASIALAIACITASSAGEHWDFLEVTPDHAIAINAVSKLIDDVVSFNLLDGYVPSGKDLGYEKQAGGRVRFFLYSCGNPTAKLSHI